MFTEVGTMWEKELLTQTTRRTASATSARLQTPRRCSALARRWMCVTSSVCSTASWSSAMHQPRAEGRQLVPGIRPVRPLDRDRPRIAAGRHHAFAPPRATSAPTATAPCRPATADSGNPRGSSRRPSPTGAHPPRSPPPAARTARARPQPPRDRVHIRSRRHRGHSRRRRRREAAPEHQMRRIRRA